MTTHAYIADLSRERRNTPGSASVYAIVAVCGLECTGADARGDIRCFGMRRLSEVWARMGHNVTCPACRGEVRRLLARRESPERLARVAALSAWAQANPLACAKGDFEAKAALERQRAYRAAKKVEHAARFKLAPPVDRTHCRYCPAVMRSAEHTTCGRGTCRARLARDLRKARGNR